MTHDASWAIRGTTNNVDITTNVTRIARITRTGNHVRRRSSVRPSPRRRRHGRPARAPPFARAASAPARPSRGQPSPPPRGDWDTLGPLVAEDDRDVEDDRAGDQSDETIAARRDMSFSERLRAPDAYGLLLVALGAVAILAGVVGSFRRRPGRTCRAAQRDTPVLVPNVAGLDAGPTRRARRRPRRDRRGRDRGRGRERPVRLGRRGRGGRRARVRSAGRDPASCRAPSHGDHWHHGRRRRVRLPPIGMFFASLYTVMAGASAEPFFAQTSVDRAIDQLYFSFVTLTTVGYGSHGDRLIWAGRSPRARPSSDSSSSSWSSRSWSATSGGSAVIEAFLAGLLAASSPRSARRSRSFTTWASGRWA